MESRRDTAGQKFLASMLERLYAAMSSGPTLNCRPANSRQRVDLTDLRLLQDITPDAILAALLGPDPSCTVHAKAAVPPPLPEAPPDPDAPPGRPRKSKASVEEDPATKAIRDAWDQQSKILRKLRAIAEDTRTYEQDTGTHALYVGWPLLSLPPGGDRTSRILAPVAFIPIDMSVQAGRRPAVELSVRTDERLVPNPALAAWLERQTGRSLNPDPAEDATPWQHLHHILTQVNSLLRLDAPPLSPEDVLLSAPRSEALTQPEVLSSAVLGLFPLANQSILSDLRDMAAGSVPSGPVESFLRADLSLNPNPAPGENHHLQGLKSAFADRCIMMADPCQSRAVGLARDSRGLVIHGPPGTGKSQTIANIIGDHLSRGQRVLMVCDKRTALDVVYQRLEHMGLAHLCAIIHDAQSDRRKLYLSIREQVEALPETREDDSPSLTLQKIDSEMQALHDEYRNYLSLLSSQPAPDAQSFSELAGEWLQSRGTGVQHVLLREETFTTPRHRLDACKTDVQDALGRGLRVNYANNAWREATELSLADYLGISSATLRQQLENCQRQATQVDQVPKSTLHFSADVRAEAAARLALATSLKGAHQSGAIHRIERWIRKSPAAWKQALQAIQENAGFRSGADAVHDRELELASKSVELLSINQDLETLRTYAVSLSNWYGFLQFGVRKHGQEVLRRYGLGSTPPADVGRLQAFLSMRRAQAMLADLCTRGLDEPEVPPTEALRAVAQHESVLRILVGLVEEPLLAAIRPTLMDRMQDNRLIEDLERSGPWAELVAAFEASIAIPALGSSFQQRMRERVRRGQPVAEPWPALLGAIEHLEDVVRIREVRSRLPADLGVALNLRLLEGFNPEEGWQTLVHRVCQSELQARLAGEPRLVSIDADRLQACQNRYLELTFAKHQVVQEQVRQVWLKRQRQRLLASTGGRLNGAGAELKRRLYVKGAHALRLRQVIAAGRQTSDGDPLFDLRPVWMASPGTVAQVFPREPVFDVVVFDEASQCRLEEAIPVMMRAARVVIAGDPKQLPPTRFFESAVIDTGEMEADTEQELFEAQQSEIEDILTAALNLEIDQAYLDVHYRSSNERLIGFSNDNFYSSRLQSIPGHPKHRRMVPPIRLVQAGGVYEKRTNKREAEEVVRIVRELLRRAEPPSIGIACFNLAQRDTLVEALDMAAQADSEFASRLAEARSRTGRDAFQGLFVKNLESVQGDERDVMIISTTFGPDPTGKFYRRFGPLGLAGGARRMNVLVTRARDEVIVVTSIPQSVYRNASPPPEGRSPNGAWYLFAYLRYAELLAEQFEHSWERRKSAAPAAGTVKQYDSQSPSRFVEALARTLAEREKHASQVYWGGDGFCIDLALQHPERAGDVTIGVLCDGTRYEKAPDPAEWDAFRTVVLKSQGWALHRVWTPHFVRNPERCLQAIQQAIAKEIEGERRPSGKTTDRS